VGSFLSLVLALLLLVGGTAYASLTKDLPSLELLPVWLNPTDGHFLQPTRIYDRSAQNLLLSLENSGIPRRYLFLSPSQSNHFHPICQR